MENQIVKSATNVFGKMGAKLQKHSPEILVVTGIVGVVASAVMACRATTKVGDILEETKEKVDQVHMVVADKSISEEEYSEEDSKKDLAIIYVQSGLKLAKVYAPAVILGAVSIVSILASNDILRKRNVALAAAYTAIDRGFKDYRNRVIERFGEEVDRELKYNIKAKKITETVIDENGKEKKVKETVDVVEGIEGYSDYARFFDDGCEGWVKDSEYNLMFLRSRQNYANDLLVSRGYLFLNDVYDMLGIPRTKAGQVVGWIYDPDNNEKGDNYVDFGIYNLHRQVNRDFVNGYEKAILLDFNVDGYILDRM